MAVSSVGSNPSPAAYTQTDAQQPSSSTSGTNGASDATQTAADAADALQASTQVTLSPQAKIIASLAARGISVEEFSFASMGLPPPPSQGGQAAALSYFEKISAAQTGAPHDANGKPDGQISQTGFEQVIQQFGGTTAQADQLFAALDTNNNSSLSHNEVLNGLAATSTDPNSAVSQSLLKLMDQNGDNSVSQDEFLALETALITAEKAPQSTSQSS